MIEYTTKNEIGAKYSLTMKTDNLLLLGTVENILRKAKSDEDNIDYVPDVQENDKPILQKDEKKTITITIEMP